MPHNETTLTLLVIQLQSVTRAYHIGCWKVDGSLGLDTGVQLYDRMIRSASRKLRNRLATRRSWRNNFWNRSATVADLYS